MLGVEMKGRIGNRLAISVILALALALVFTGCAQPTPAPAPAPKPAPAPAPKPAPAPAPKPAPAPAPKPEPKPEPIVLKAVTFIPARAMGSTKQSVLDIWEKITERSNGELVIEYVGGPEVIASYEQAEAVRKGAIDMTVVPAAYYQGFLPGVDVFHLSRLSIEEERKPGGFNDYMQELHAKAGLRYFSRSAYLETQNWVVSSSMVITKPDDIKGMKLGPGMIAPNFILALGASPTRIHSGELYNGMKQGVVDGAVHPLSGAGVRYSWQEVLKSIVDHPFFRDNVPAIMSLDAWNRIPKHLQDLIKEIEIEVANE